MHRVYQQYSPSESPPSYYDIEQSPSDVTKQIAGRKYVKLIC
jgi:hypothetical protein